MKSRRRMNKRESKKRFTRSAVGTHKANASKKPLMRGGIRW